MLSGILGLFMILSSAAILIFSIRSGSITYTAYRCRWRYQDGGHNPDDQGHEKDLAKAGKTSQVLIPVGNQTVNQDSNADQHSSPTWSSWRSSDS